MELTVDGLRYHVEVDGEGPVLLLLHGFTGSVRTWDPWVDRWSARWRVVRVDLPGHGQSAVPADPGRIAMERVCRDLAGILEQLGAERAHVLGYSMGGRTALSFALLYPEKVAALVLESASPGLAGDPERRKRVDRDNAMARRIETEGVPAFVQWWEEIPLFATQKRLSSDIQKKVRAERLSHTPAGLAASLRGMGTGVQPSWWDQLNSLDHPVLLLVGEEDQKFCDVARRMKTRLPHAQLEVVKDAGHAVHVERPDFFGTIVTDFMERW